MALLWQFVVFFLVLATSLQCSGQDVAIQPDVVYGQR